MGWALAFHREADLRLCHAINRMSPKHDVACDRAHNARIVAPRAIQRGVIYFGEPRNGADNLPSRAFVDLEYRPNAIL